MTIEFGCVVEGQGDAAAVPGAAVNQDPTR